MSRMEVLYNVWRGEGEDAARHALRLMDSFAVQWVTCRTGYLGDCFPNQSPWRAFRTPTAGLGQPQLSTAQLWSIDPEFEPFKEIPQEILK